VEARKRTLENRAERQYSRYLNEYVSTGMNDYTRQSERRKTPVLEGRGCIAQLITRVLIKENQYTSNLQNSSDEFMEGVYSTFENGDKIANDEGPPRFVNEAT
jgi:hypothetical protein